MTWTISSAANGIVALGVTAKSYEDSGLSSGLEL